MPDITPSFRTRAKAKKKSKTPIGNCKRSIRRSDGTVSQCTLPEHEFPIWCEDDRARAAKERLEDLKDRVEVLPFLLAVFGIHVRRSERDYVRGDAWNMVWRGEA